MTLKEQFLVILEKEKDCVPFLQSLSTDQKKSLVPELKKLSKEYFEFKFYILENVYRTKAKPAQRDILHLAAFVCYNFKDYQKLDPTGYIVDKKILSKVIDWYCPDWLSTYINNLANLEYGPFTVNYDWLMELTEKGLVNPDKPIIVKLLQNALYENGTDKWRYNLEYLTKRELTLSTHIWYFFDTESQINWNDRNIEDEPIEKKAPTGWINAFKTYSSVGKTDRKRLLKESILASCRNFNKTLSGWFAELMIQLEPTNEEIIDLQNELFTSLSSPYSKPTNTSLNFIKRVVDEDSFDVDGFLGSVSLLITSETKSIVSTSLQILEKIGKNFTDKSEEICVAACQVFIHKDNALQIKGAKLIAKFGTTTSTQILETLAHYEESLLVESKALLKDYLNLTSVTNSINVELGNVPSITSTSLAEIQNITNLDDFLFLASQAFDNNESYHFDLLPSALISFQDEIKSNIGKLSPAFQRAYKIVANEMPSTLGYLDHLLATFFIEFGRELVKTFPRESSSIKVLEDKYGRSNNSLVSWKQKDPIYEPYKQLLLTTLSKLKKNDTLPLLSTPTHAPGWISPETLVRRISLYQKSKSQPNSIDFQIAISRLNLTISSIENTFIERELFGEYRNLMLFLTKKEERPLPPFTNPELWMLAGITKDRNTTYPEFKKFSYSDISKNYFTGQFKWRSLSENYTYDTYDHKQKKYVKATGRHGLIRILFDSKRCEIKDISLKGLFSKILPIANSDEKLLYEFLEFRSNYFSIEHNDIKRLLMLTPNNPEATLAQVLHKNLTYSTFSQESDRKMAIKTLEALHEIWSTFGETAHLFVATAMMGSEKTARNYGAEIWIKGVNEETINSELLGTILGKHVNTQFAPVKRLTDLIYSNMYQVSAHHNLQLEVLLTALIRELSESPIDNLKKLLEIYLEVISRNNSFVKDEKIMPLMLAWKTGGNLSKVIKGLEERENIIINI